MNAEDFLKQAQSEMCDRAATYDKPAGERSMAATVAMFNALTGHNLTEEQGWKFMCCLKLVRSEQGAYRADNFVDGAAYFGLAGETAASDYANCVAVTRRTPTQRGNCDVCGLWDSQIDAGVCPACTGKFLDNSPEEAA